MVDVCRLAATVQFGNRVTIPAETTLHTSTQGRHQRTSELIKSIKQFASPSMIMMSVMCKTIDD